jgi:hypothetical protein
MEKMGQASKLWCTHVVKTTTSGATYETYPLAQLSNTVEEAIAVGIDHANKSENIPGYHRDVHPVSGNPWEFRVNFRFGNNPEPRVIYYYYIVPMLLPASIQSVLDLLGK